MTLEFEQIQKEEIRKNRETRYVDLLVREGIDFATGVPCGVQKYVIESLSTRPEIIHLSATRESEAIGIAAGAYLAGRRPVVYMQNSGLLDCVNDISSLLLCYKIPILLSVSWRGAPGEDAPQHFVNGAITPSILRALDIPYFILDWASLELISRISLLEMKRLEKPAVILVKRGIF